MKLDIVKFNLQSNNQRGKSPFWQDNARYGPSVIFEKIFYSKYQNAHFSIIKKMIGGMPCTKNEAIITV